MSYSQPQPGWGQQYYPPPKPERPLGITILAILGFLSGILAILGGILMAVVGSAFVVGMTKAPVFPLAGLFGAFGIVLIIAGLIELVISWGLWTGKGWAWWLGVIFSGLGLLFALVSIVSGNLGGIVSLIIDGLILYYFFKPHVKQFFGITVGFST